MVDPNKIGPSFSVTGSDHYSVHHNFGLQMWTELGLHITNFGPRLWIEIGLCLTISVHDHGPILFWHFEFGPRPWTEIGLCLTISVHDRGPKFVGPFLFRSTTVDRNRTCINMHIVKTMIVWGSLLVNSRHPGPRRVWKVGSQQRCLARFRGIRG